MTMTTKRNVTLWVVQGLLASVFLLAGGMKLVAPPEALAGPIPLPVLFIRFIGVCEVLGAIGLILPWLLRIRPVLTPLAASGLVVIMTGAAVLSAIFMTVAAGIGPLVIGTLAALVAYNRYAVVDNLQQRLA
jgi:uncharacterized membrane protein YphA (DoxX/SURF4 family)